MAFTESLTVRILGDSSGLQRELLQVLQNIDELHQRIDSTTRATSQIGTALSRVSQATGPLQQISGLLARVGQQARSLSQQPVNLNVSPALNSLQRLMQSISTVAAQLRNISAASAMASMPSFAPMAEPSLARLATRRMASGGLIAGPSGIDQIPARLTAGEYVLNQHAVQTLGQSFVDQLNLRPESLLGQMGRHSTIPWNDQHRSGSSSTLPRAHFEMARVPTSARDVNMPSIRTPYNSESISQTTSNHFGGITVVVNQAGEVSDVVQRIEQQQRALRNRRG